MSEPKPQNVELHETQPLLGKIAVITGTSRGIGAETAKALARVGVDIVGTHVDPSKEKRQNRVAGEVTAAGVTFTSVLADISEPEGREALVQAAVHPQGQDQVRNIDYLILNAAGGLEENKGEGWAERINIESQLALVDEFLPYMNEGGKIIYLTSLWAHRYGEVQQLPAYEPVAKTKNKAEQELRARILEMQEWGVSLGILSGHIIKGTAAHILFTRMAKERMAELEAKAEGGKFPEAAEMGNAVRDMLLMNFESGYTHNVGGTEAEPLEQRVVRSFDRNEISELLPMYSDEKLLVDEFDMSEEGNTGIGRYTVRPRDTEGHFGGDYEDIQLFRGVDQIEAAAQTLGLTYKTGQQGSEGIGVFSGIQGPVQFEHMVFPGDTVEMHATITSETARALTGNCEIKVDGQTVTMIEGIEVGLIPNIRMARMFVNRERNARNKARVHDLAENRDTDIIKP